MLVVLWRFKLSHLHNKRPIDGAGCASEVQICHMAVWGSTKRLPMEESTLMDDASL